MTTGNAMTGQHPAFRAERGRRVIALWLPHFAVERLGRGAPRRSGAAPIRYRPWSPPSGGVG